MRPLTANPSPHAVYMRTWRAKHPEYREYQLAYQAEYHKDSNNAAKARRRAAEWYKRNTARALLQSKLNYETNKDAHNQRQKEWIKKNIERHRAYKRMDQSSRRALIAESGITLEMVIAKCGDVCGVCKLAITGKCHVDHIIPISKGGKHTLDNLQLTHPRCNQSKSGKV